MGVIFSVGRKLYWLARVLWACRISLVSSLAGLVLFGSVVQAQNLFLDTSFASDPVLDVLYWAGVFGALALVWAFPVHYGARRTLNDPAWIVSRQTRAAFAEPQVASVIRRTYAAHPRLILAVPRLLGLLPFAAFGLGLWGAMGSISDAAARDPQCEVCRQIRILLGVDVIVALAFFVFLVARRHLVAWMARKLSPIGTGSIPGERRLEGLATLCAGATFVIFVGAYVAPLLVSSVVARAALIPFLLGSLVLPLSILARRSHRHGIPFVALAVGVVILITGLNLHGHDLRVLPPVASGPGAVTAPSGAAADRQTDFDDAVAQWQRANGCAAPGGAACPPALIVAAEGGASRAAFATATVIGDLLDRAVSRGDLVRDQTPAHSLFALSGVSGGAFGAAAIRAAIEEAAESGDPRRAPCRHADRTWFDAAAVGEGQPTFSWRQCLQALTSGDFVSPVFVGLAFRDPLSPSLCLLPACGPVLADRAVLLEQAWERHYDRVMGREASWFTDECEADGETGLCRRFGYLGGSAALQGHPEGWIPLLLLNGTSVETGRRVIVSDLASTRRSPDGKSRIALYPQAYDLFEALSTPCGLKAADPEAGCVPPPGAPAMPQRLDGPDLRLSTAALASARFPIVSPAGTYYSGGQLRFGDRVVDGGYFENSGLTTALDIAEALHAKGLTPVILSITNEPRVPLSASDPTPVRTLRSVLGGLGPASTPIEQDVRIPARPAVTPVLGPSSNDSLIQRAFSLILAPVEALGATRQGHGAEAADLVVARLDQMNGPGLGAAASFYTVDVFLDETDASAVRETRACLAQGRQPLSMKSLSMSWWLSASIQRDLDAQLCNSRNRQQIDDLVRRLSGSG